MKRLTCLLLCLSTELIILAQRGRYWSEEYPDYKLDNPLFAIIAAAFIIGLIWFRVSLNKSRKKEVTHKTIFITIEAATAFLDAGSVIRFHDKFYDLCDYYKEIDGVIRIPINARCIILEYVSENHSFVKVKFDDYPIPLYFPRWKLRTQEEIKKKEIK